MVFSIVSKMKLFEICIVLLIVCFKDSVCNTDCGGEIRHFSGIISSPNFPKSYPDYKSCAWTFNAPERQVVSLRFLHVDMANNFDSECADSVTVHDGSSDAFPILATLCGYHAPEELSNLRIRSSGNTLHVKFSSDGYEHNSGFDATYNIQDCPPYKYGNESCDKPCSCVQSNTLYCNSINALCVCKPGWTSADCSEDINECAASNVELCQENYQQCVNTNATYTCECRPGMVKDSLGRCKVLPTAQCTVTQCSHTCVKLPTGIEQCYCPQNMMLDGNTCKDCQHLSFGDECRLKCDSCNVSNTEKCDNQTGECVCNPGWTGKTCADDVNECTTRFAYPICEASETCINTVGSFHCTGCNQVLNMPSGEIISPNYPGPYTSKLWCETLISIPNKMATITLTFSDINVESFDFISIFDGPNTSSPLIASFSGVHNDVLIRSTQNNMLILFSTDDYVVSKGFHGSYVSKEIPGCGSTLTGPSGTISGGSYATSTDDFYFCYWNFVGSQYYHIISLNFTDLELGHSLDCSEGYLQVFNSSDYKRYTNVVKFCAHNFTSFIRSANERMSVTYVFKGTGVHPKINGIYDISDCSWKYGDRCERNCTCDETRTKICNNLNGNCECRHGFQANCSLDINECTERYDICSSNLSCHNTRGGYGCLLNKTDLNGTFECYSNDDEYTVYITGPPNTVVSLSVSNFNMSYEPFGLCTFYMNVYDGNSTRSRQIGHYCGSRIPKLLRTTQNVMLLEKKNYSGRETCHVEYQIEQCPSFSYGPACSRECPCLRNNSKSCDNLYGVCECKSGWTGSDCSVDIDECQYIKNCTLNSECKNTPGSYVCECWPGYEYDNLTKGCLYVDKCSRPNLNLCSYKDRCRDTASGITCSCPAGQKLDNDNRTCIDCDGNTWGTQCAIECACSIHADHCDPVIGCVCKTGFNGFYCNEDINECANGQQQCSTNEICVNKPGAAECQCQNGFIINNGICSDIDECSTGQHQCSDICTNTEGSYMCSCFDGQPLQSDGLSCGRLNQSCDLDNKCPDHLQCNNFKCHCFNGLLPDSNGQCLDCNRDLTAPNGMIMSSNYPLNYPDNSDCTWTIITNITNGFISISFQDYQLEGCPFDSVKLYDGSSKMAKQLDSLCESVPSSIRSTGNTMYIVFTSDRIINRKGFLATYTTGALCLTNLCSHTCHVTSTNPWIETCSCPEWMSLDVTGKQCVVTHACNATIKASSGYIVSPNYPLKYPYRTNCYWTIEASTNSSINLSFSEVKLEYGAGCNHDYIILFDGSNQSAPLLGRYCDFSTPETISTSHNFMHIVFQSDGWQNNKGFKSFFTVI